MSRGHEAQRSRKWAIEAILFLTYTVFAISWMSISPIAKDLMAFFQVDKPTFAYLATVVGISKVIAPMVAGGVAARIGVSRTILIGSILISVVLVGPLYPNFKVFLVTRAVFGIGGAIVVTLMPSIVMQWFSKEELPTVNGINGVAANTGFALALFGTARIAASPLGWQGTLLLFGGVSALLMVLWALLGRDNKSSVRAAASGEAAKQIGFVDVWKMRETWLIALSFTGPVALYLTLSVWLPTHFQESFGIAKVQASQYASIPLFVGIPSGIISGILTKKLGIRRPFLIVGGIVAGIASFGTFMFPSPTIIVISGIVFGTFLFVPTAALTTTLMELDGVTPRHVSLIAGTMFSFCYTISSFVPNVVGWVGKQTGSFVVGFAGVAIFSFVVVLGGFLLPETGPKGARARQRTDALTGARATS